MAVVEGYAEHVMDAVGADVLPSLEQLRDSLERRRQARSTPLRLLERLLGLELKMRQYRDGKRFCDTVVAEAGIGALNRVWAGPESLPTLAELASPTDWLTRTSVPSVTS
jgi:putative hydrolase